MRQYNKKNMAKEKIQLNLPKQKNLQNLPEFYRHFFDELKKNGSTENRTNLNKAGHDIIETSWDDDSYPPIY